MEGKVILSAWSPNRLVLQVENDAACYLVVNEAWHTGWHCRDESGSEVKALKVYRANYLFRAVFIEPGKHELNFRFLPAAYRIGKALSAAGWLSLVVLLVAGRFVRRLQ